MQMVGSALNACSGPTYIEPVGVGLSTGGKANVKPNI